MSRGVLKLVLGLNVIQKWIMTDFQGTVAACALLANAVLLWPDGSSPLPGLCTRMGNSDGLMHDCYFSLPIHLG